MSVGVARPRFDVRLEGRCAHLRLAAPVDAACVRLVHLEAALEPLAGRVDLRGGALAFRHRRSVAVEADLDVDVVALLEHARAHGVRVAIEGADARGIVLRVEDGRGATTQRVEPSPEGTDLRLRAGEGDVAARLLAAWPIEHGVEPSKADVLVRDPIGWGMREALVPLGFRAPRVDGGTLACAIAGRRLRLSLRAGAA